MNNFLYGNACHQNYETTCGGTGAGPDHPGLDAVHSHMTNTRMTDPEVLSNASRYGWRSSPSAPAPAATAARAGPGRVRRLRFLEPMTATLLSSHRVTEPYGLAGGGPGARGRNRLLRADGRVIELRGDDEVRVRAGDQIVIETPGGGFGPEG